MIRALGRETRKQTMAILIKGKFISHRDGCGESPSSVTACEARQPCAQCRRRPVPWGRLTRYHYAHQLALASTHKKKGGGEESSEVVVLREEKREG